ncbi:MAG: 3-deoxy-7-phosphoheptulonate synthase [bacterium]|nr:3-deoxy-7-phosphoheptulonate synthase [bacterium]
MTVTRDELLKLKPLIIAGPCAVESREQLFSIADKLHGMGVKVMRCQLWKPRTDRASFQGIGMEGAEWIKEIKDKYGFIIATEVLDREHVDLTKGVSDILWIGARNMQNFELLKKVGDDPRPAILKRGFIATLDEWMASAKYIGLDKVILCERGVRTGADSMRFTMDINTALVAKYDKNMPVLIDPSHSAGRADMVSHLTYAAIASGIDGLIIEVHNTPTEAQSDKAQQITPEIFKEIYKKVLEIYEAVH